MACEVSRVRWTRVSCGDTSCKERRWKRAARNASPQLCALPTNERSDSALTQRLSLAELTRSVVAACLTAKQRRARTESRMVSELKA